jgi:hypothetical protein
MFLKLSQTGRWFEVPLFSGGVYALRIQNENRGLRLAALEQHGHRDLQCLDSRLKNQNALTGDQQACVNLKQSPVPGNGIMEMDPPIKALVSPCGAPVPLPPQLPARFARFVLFAKVPDENA